MWVTERVVVLQPASSRVPAARTSSGVRIISCLGDDRFDGDSVEGPRADVLQHQGVLALLLLGPLDVADSQEVVEELLLVAGGGAALLEQRLGAAVLRQVLVARHDLGRARAGAGEQEREESQAEGGGA